ncbi:MAG TPA: hypothetical protein DEB06_08085 [Phycisphaerales bacterium]|nr:hypothetical protein [Phycisphaerales bacterium]
MRARPRPYRPGFTLVEVLIATFVIALGVLGLLALFAGAARQQQVASLTSRAHAHARNAESILGVNFGNLRNTSNNFIPGVWYQLPMQDQFHYLTVNPRRATGGAYFLTPSEASPRLVWTVLNFDDADVPVTPDPGNGGIVDLAADAGVRRLDPASLSFLVTLIDTGTRQTVTLPPYVRTPALEPQYTDRPETSGVASYMPGGLPTSQPGQADADYIRVNLELAANGTTPARVLDMNIRAVDPAGTLVIKSIVAFYRIRSDELVSLRDRVLFQPDQAAPNGERPVLAYSVLYRTVGSLTQMAVVSYSLTAGSGGAEWIPPERLSDIQRDPQPTPVRGVRLRLGFDKDRQAYYLTNEGPEEQSAFALAVGQIILIAGTNAANPGADAPVTVVGQQRLNNQLRAYLDRAPRSGGRNILPAQRRENDQLQNVIAFAVNDVAVSLDNDSSEWRLRALSATVYQVGGN